jgi:hypothetical protein
MSDPRIPNLNALLRVAAEPSIAQSACCAVCGGFLDFGESDEIGRVIEQCFSCGWRKVIVARRLVEPANVPTEGVLRPYPPSIRPTACECGCGAEALPTWDARQGFWRPAPKYATAECRSAASSARHAGRAARLRAAGTNTQFDCRRGAA